MGNIWAREIIAVSDPALIEVKRIYRASIPEQERLPESVFDRAIQIRASGEEAQDHTARLLVTLEDRLPVGFAFVHFFQREHFGSPLALGYLLYMAVDEQQRGKGVGRSLYHSVVGLLSIIAMCRGQTLAGIIFEVERPDCADSLEKRRFCERRITFYERLGAKVLEGIDYVQPPVSDRLPPVPMFLMYHALAEELPPITLCKMFYKLVFGFEDDHPAVLSATQSQP